MPVHGNSNNDLNLFPFTQGQEQQAPPGAIEDSNVYTDSIFQPELSANDAVPPMSPIQQSPGGLSLEAMLDQFEREKDEEPPDQQALRASEVPAGIASATHPVEGAAAAEELSAEELSAEELSGEARPPPPLPPDRHVDCSASDLALRLGILPQEGAEVENAPAPAPAAPVELPGFGFGGSGFASSAFGVAMPPPTYVAQEVQGPGAPQAVATAVPLDSAVGMLLPDNPPLSPPAAPEAAPQQQQQGPTPMNVEPEPEPEPQAGAKRKRAKRSGPSVKEGKAAGDGQKTRDCRGKRKMTSEQRMRGIQKLEEELEDAPAGSEQRSEMEEKLQKVKQEAKAKRHAASNPDANARNRSEVRQGTSTKNENWGVGAKCPGFFLPDEICSAVQMLQQLGCSPAFRETLVACCVPGDAEAVRQALLKAGQLATQLMLLALGQDEATAQALEQLPQEADRLLGRLLSKAHQLLWMSVGRLDFSAASLVEALVQAPGAPWGDRPVAALPQSAVALLQFPDWWVLLRSLGGRQTAFHYTGEGMDAEVLAAWRRATRASGKVPQPEQPPQPQHLPVFSWLATASEDGLFCDAGFHAEPEDLCFYALDSVAHGCSLACICSLFESARLSLGFAADMEQQVRDHYGGKVPGPVCSGGQTTEGALRDVATLHALISLLEQRRGGEAPAGPEDKWVLAAKGLRERLDSEIKGRNDYQTKATWRIAHGQGCVVDTHPIASVAIELLVAASGSGTGQRMLKQLLAIPMVVLEPQKEPRPLSAAIAAALRTGGCCCWSRACVGTATRLLLSLSEAAFHGGQYPQPLQQGGGFFAGLAPWLLGALGQPLAGCGAVVRLLSHANEGRPKAKKINFGSCCVDAHELDADSPIGLGARKVRPIDSDLKGCTNRNLPGSETIVARVFGMQVAAFERSLAEAYAGTVLCGKPLDLGEGPTMELQFAVSSLAMLGLALRWCTAAPLLVANGCSNRCQEEGARVPVEHSKASAKVREYSGVSRYVVRLLNLAARGSEVHSELLRCTTVALLQHISPDLTCGFLLSTRKALCRNLTNGQVVDYLKRATLVSMCDQGDPLKPHSAAAALSLGVWRGLARNASGLVEELPGSLLGDRNCNTAVRVRLACLVKPTPADQPSDPEVDLERNWLPPLPAIYLADRMAPAPGPEPEGPVVLYQPNTSKNLNEYTSMLASAGLPAPDCSASAPTAAHPVYVRAASRLLFASGGRPCLKSESPGLAL